MENLRTWRWNPCGVYLLSPRIPITGATVGQCWVRTGILMFIAYIWNKKQNIYNRGRISHFLYNPRSILQNSLQPFLGWFYKLSFCWSFAVFVSSNSTSFFTRRKLPGDLISTINGHIQILTIPIRSGLSNFHPWRFSLEVQLTGHQHISKICRLVYGLFHHCFKKSNSFIHPKGVTHHSFQTVATLSRL